MPAPTPPADRPDLGVVAAWVTAWLQGAVAADDVASALAGVGSHRVRGLATRTRTPGGPGEAASAGPDPATDPGGDAAGAGAASEPLSAALIAWRRRGAEDVRLVLPVPGDVRGLPAGAPAFTAAALAAGLVLLGAGLALVPTLAGSGQLVVWEAWEVGAAPPDPLTVRQAQVDLAAAMRESAAVLAAADLAAPGGATADELRAARRAGERLELPPGHPGPAVALLASARRLAAVLELAARDPRGGAVDRTGFAVRDGALAAVATAVRRARLAACNAWTEPAR